MGSACSRHPDVIEYKKIDDRIDINLKKEQEQIGNINENNKNNNKQTDFKSNTINPIEDKEVKEYIKGDIIGEGKIGITHSSLCFNTGKIVCLKIIDLSAFTQSPEILKEKLIKDFDNYNKMNYKHENLNDYLTYQDYKDKPNSKFILISNRDNFKLLCWRKH